MPAVAEQSRAGHSGSSGQSFALLLFESVSAGIMAVFVGFVAVLAVVGVYVVLVWPLTFWDLGNLHLEQYSEWYHPALWSVFGAGTLFGFLCFSGVIFGKRKATGPAGPIRVQRTEMVGAGRPPLKRRVEIGTRR